MWMRMPVIQSRGVAGAEGQPMRRCINGLRLSVIIAISGQPCLIGAGPVNLQAYHTKYFLSEARGHYGANVVVVAAPAPRNQTSQLPERGSTSAHIPRKNGHITALHLPKVPATIHERYLIVFDSAEIFDTPLELDRIRCEAALPERLRSFIDAATQLQSMVIIASRLDTTSIAHNPSIAHTPSDPDDYMYHLRGLGVLDSVRLLQQLSVEPNKELPETFYRRENIDSLRRAAIILEGNPEAIQLVAPELKKTHYNGAAFLDILHFGVCTTIGERDVSTKSRFNLSLLHSLVVSSFVDFNTASISVVQFAPFWNLMPKDLTIYYVSLSWPLENLRQASIHDWRSDESLKLAANTQMGRIVRTHWPDFEAKLIKAGVLNHATITKKNSTTVPCYHIHLLVTLYTRASMDMGSQVWTHTRFAFIRQSLLWDPNDLGLDWAEVCWNNDPIHPHDDHLHNWRPTAMAWAVQDGNPLQEINRMRVSLFDCTYSTRV